jgi:hypothetical protein
MPLLRVAAPISQLAEMIMPMRHEVITESKDSDPLDLDTDAVAADDSRQGNPSLPCDPRPRSAQSEQARRRRIEKAREMGLAARAWEREHGPVADPAVYEREILPRSGRFAFGGSSPSPDYEYYLWGIRKGQGRLHARFWDLIASA